ncbi:MAG TPA: gas vesicle protein [Segeticoccus sp.]|jgi:hypothetical protein|nr:gas vesicle protein [Segeticoccus sp.]
MDPVQTAVAQAAEHRPTEPIALVDLLDRLLGVGVVLTGDVTISIAGIDLVEVRLAAIISSIRPELLRGGR